MISNTITQKYQLFMDYDAIIGNRHMKHRVVLVLESNLIIQPMQHITVLLFIIGYDNQN